MSSSFLKIKKDKKIRREFKKKELNIVLYKYVTLSSNNLNNKRFYTFEFIRKFHLNSSSSRIVNRCIFTGRAKWVLSRFKVSRIKFKELCDNGKLHSIRRSSY